MALLAFSMRPLAPQQATAQAHGFMKRPPSCRPFEVCERAFLSVPFLSRFMANFSGCSCAVAVAVRVRDACQNKSQRNKCAVAR